MKTWRILLPLVFIVISSRLPAETMTLNQAMLETLKNDPVIQKIHANAIEADGFATEVRATRRPQVSFNADGGYGYRSRSIGGLAEGGKDLFDRRAGLLVEQLIWDNGSSCYRWKDAKFRRKATVLLDKAQRETSAMGSVEAYLYVLRARKQIQMAQKNLSAHQRFYKLAKDRANGVGDEADVKLAFARLQLAKALREERDLDLSQAEADYHRYTGRKPPVLVHPKVPSISSAESINYGENFHYQATLHQCKAAQLASAAIKRSRSPRVMSRGTGSYGVDVLGIEGTDKEASALLVMQWDLVEGGRKNGLMRQAEGDIVRQIAIVKETQILLERDIRTRWADYSTLSERIEILESYTKGLEDTVSLYRKQFELNKRPLLSLLDIENEKISSEMRLIDEHFERALNAYRLLFYGGRLIRSTVGEIHLECDEYCLNRICPPPTEHLTSDPECIEKCEPVVVAKPVSSPRPAPVKISEPEPTPIEIVAAETQTASPPMIVDTPPETDESTENKDSLKEFISLAVIDGSFDEDEKKAILGIGSKLGFDDEQVRAIYHEVVLVPSAAEPLPTLKQVEVPTPVRSSDIPEAPASEMNSAALPTVTPLELPSSSRSSNRQRRVTPEKTRVVPAVPYAWAIPVPATVATPPIVVPMIEPVAWAIPVKLEPAKPAEEPKPEPAVVETIETEVEVEQPQASVDTNPVTEPAPEEETVSESNPTTAAPVETSIMATPVETPEPKRTFRSFFRR